jgi:hypothetical protein
MHAFVRLAPLLLAAAAALAQAQQPTKDPQPDLHGHWTLIARGDHPATAPFDLENIKRKDDGTFAARLTWTMPDARCTIRYQQITGRVTPPGLSFEWKTPCNDVFHAQLEPGAAGAWVGQATSQAAPPAVMELSAK